MPIAASGPQFTAIPGYGLLGIRSGIQLSEDASLILDASNLFDKNYRGVAARFRYQW